MSWNNDWPVMGNDNDKNGIGEPVLQHRKPNVGKSYSVVTPKETDDLIKETAKAKDREIHSMDDEKKFGKRSQLHYLVGKMLKMISNNLTTLGTNMFMLMVLVGKALLLLYLL